MKITVQKIVFYVDAYLEDELIEAIDLSDHNFVLVV